MTVKTINNVAKANVKTINGVAIASAKTINGVNLVPSVPEAFFAATGITDGTIQGAITDLYDDLVGYGLWSKIYALWPFVGGDATKHSYNLVNTAQYQLSFSGGWTHSANGALPDGVTGTYADTGLNPSTVIASVTDFSLGMYSRTQTDSPSPTWDMGIGGTGGSDTIMGLYVGRSGYESAFDSPVNPDTYARTQFTGSSSQKMFIGSATATNHRELYRDGTSIATNTTSYTSQAFESANMWIGAINPTTGLSYNAAHQFALAFVAQGLNDTEAANFTTAVNTFQTALSRNV